jgi:hypothetical protein
MALSREYRKKIPLQKNNNLALLFNVLSLGLVIVGLLNYIVFIFFFFLSLFIVGMDLRKTSAIHQDLSGRFSFLGSLGDLLELINNESFEAPLINSMKKGVLADEKLLAVIALRELGGNNQGI